jgi:hypothetical protein
MIKRILKYPFRIARQQFQTWQNERYVTDRVNHHSRDIDSFNFPALKNNVVQFLRSLQTDDSGVRYRYAASCTEPTLYSSAYACMTYSLLNELSRFDLATRKNWIEYFNSFQRQDTGLFYDPQVDNKHFNDSDWWGARHLVLHMISAYTDLGERPVYPFRFLEPYYNHHFLHHWLLENDEKFTGSMDHDFDNKLMNIVCLLQYQRDFWKDETAARAVKYIQQELIKKINPQTGLWGDSHLEDPAIRSRKVQFAYHLFPIFFYDDLYPFDIPKIIDVVLKTGNAFGGYGVRANSSACEDIDSLDILVRLSRFSEALESGVQVSLKKNFRWTTANQMEDGGFVFRLNEKFVYGHEQMSSKKNEGAIFPTWFRTLSLAYLNKYFELPGDFKITRCPGYEF